MPIDDKTNYVDTEKHLRLRPALPGQPIGLENEVRLFAQKQTRAGMVTGSVQRPHILDKMDRLNEKGREFDLSLEADVDKLTGRYDEIQAKKDKVFQRQHLALDDRDKALDAVDERLDRLSNLGNSSGGSKPPNNGGGES